jgi:hypothetical protein
VVSTPSWKSVSHFESFGVALSRRSAHKGGQEESECEDLHFGKSSMDWDSVVKNVCWKRY